MENENKKELMKVFKKNKTAIKTAFICIGVAIFCLCLGIIIDSRPLPEAKELAEVGEENIYSKAKIYALTDYFATYGVDNDIEEKYYFALGDDVIYILDLSDEQYNELESKVNDEENTDGIDVYGMSEEVSIDLQKYAVDSLNELYETDEILYSNYNDFFTPYSINAKKSPNDTSDIFITFFCVTGIAGIVSIIVYLISIAVAKSKIKKVAKKYDIAQVSLELSSQDKVEFKETKTIFLQSYLISYSNPFDIIKYTDMIWAYPHENKVNGIKSTTQIYLVTKDNKLHVISSCSAFGKKNKEAFVNTYNELLGRRKNMLAGYTRENIEAMSKNNREETIQKIIEQDNI